jgi:pyruvate dehydrogenase E2 component (dihydrolipoamide acetyltransferase)
MPDVLMPRLSDTMEEGVLRQWLKSEGDEVHKGDVLAEIETDKATMELEAYDDSVLERRLIAEGATVPVGQPIALIGDGSHPASGAAPSYGPARWSVGPPSNSPFRSTTESSTARRAPPSCATSRPSSKRRCGSWSDRMGGVRCRTRRGCCGPRGSSGG